MVKFKPARLTLIFLSISSHLWAQEDIERISILGGREKALTQPGSAFFLDEEDLGRFKYDDIHRILKDIPGVNIQEEDGFGLRPNIGLRGAHPHRSRKVTLLEDGVLIGPAPYSAPAAYYFPMAYRATGVEVFKGPSSTKFGPNSIGGAVNLTTRPLSDEGIYSIRAETGSFNTKKIQGYFGDSIGTFRYLVEGGRIESDGFKTLTDGGDTGFEKDDIMVKASYQFSSQQYLSLKLVRAHEKSFETYLGLTQQDFDHDPYQRYAASERDKMVWNRDQVMATHGISWDQLQLTTRVYRHWFRRNWSKFNGFFGDIIDPRTVLLEPVGANEIYYTILKGLEDSNSLTNIVVGDNRRTYLVEGIQWDGTYETPSLLNSSLELNFGLRYHSDQIDRDHSEEVYIMESGHLISDPTVERKETNQLQDSSEAVSSYLEAVHYWDNLRWSFGVRSENVSTNSHDGLSENSTDISNSDSITTFGTGLFYQLTPNFGLMGGINQGVTLVGPGQADFIEPEMALNSELGVRYSEGARRFDLIGFHSNYENIKGTCTFSSGCSDADLDKEFNGGQATIQGWELSHRDRHSFGRWDLLGSLSYTYTEAYLTESRNSLNPEWGVGIIEINDPLPYIAKHSLAATLGFAVSGLEATLSYQNKSSMFDQSVADGRKELPAYSVVDLSGSWSYSDGQQVYIKADNILGEKYLVSYRPYGLRPGKPQMLFLGYSFTAF